MNHDALILLIDGLDYDYLHEELYPLMPYENRLEIPKALYHEGVPHTQKVYPSILRGEIIDKTPSTPVPVKPTRNPIKNLGKWILGKLGYYSVTKDWRKNIQNWKLAPELNPKVFYWNIPTLCPEAIPVFPTLDIYRSHVEREYETWKALSWGLAEWTGYPVAFTYTRRLDEIGHRHDIEKAHGRDPLIKAYEALYDYLRLLKRHTLEHEKVLLIIADHGTVNGHHTDHGYLGSDVPIEAETSLEVLDDIERITGLKLWENPK